MAMHDDITDIAGIRVGHDTNLEAGTGCTVILCDPPAMGGVDVRGGAPATRETDLLRPLHLVERVNAVLLTGGSAFGLDAASGVMRYLEERNIGHDTFVARVPIVPAAAIFDLAFASASTRPDAASGYRACENATGGPVAQGNVGAGTGATCNKTHGPLFALKGGLGSASSQLLDGTLVGAIVVVNAFGDVINPQTQRPFGRGQQPAQDVPPANLSATPPLPSSPPVPSSQKRRRTKWRRWRKSALHRPSGLLTPCSMATQYSPLPSASNRKRRRIQPRRRYRPV